MLKLKDIVGKLSWSSIASLVYILIQSLVFLYLSYHLPPTVFGNFSIAISIILLGINIIENGLPQSIIQTDNPDKLDYNAVLFLNIKTAFYYSIFTVLIILPIVLSFVDNAFMFPLLALLPCLFLAAFNKVQIVGLQKNLEFKSIALLETLSSISYMIFVILTVYLDLGIWILVIPFIAKYISVTLLINIIGFKYSDKLFSSNMEYAKIHWRFGKYIQGEKIISSVLSYADVFIITATLGVEILGIYDVLKRIILRPILLLYNGLEQLFYPILVGSKHDINAYLGNYNFFNKFSKYLFINFTCVLYICSPYIINIFPDSYGGFLFTLKLLCVFASIVIVMNPIDIILYSLGKSKLFFKWILSYTIPLLFVVYFTSLESLNTMLIGQIVFYSLLYLVSYFILMRKTPIHFKAYFNGYVYAFVVYLILIIGGI